MAQPPMTNPTGEERRRSPRVRLAIPVDVEWTGEDQVPVREHAETEVLNAYGGLLRMKPRFPIPLQIHLTNPRTSQTTWARVVGFREPKPKGSQPNFLGRRLPTAPQPFPQLGTRRPD